MQALPARAAMLGEDLGVLVRDLNASLTDVTPLSRRGPDHRATAFRLHFSDGRMCKGAILETAQQAEEVARVAGGISHCGIPVVLGQRGTAVLTEWIAGNALADGACSADTLRRCGGMQARAHAAPVPPERCAAPADILRRRRRNLERDLTTLGASAWLDRARLQQAEEAADRFAPSTCTVGSILGDFCTENVVRTVSGELFMVDIETLSTDACEYDLARTWYRWPMTAEERGHYWEGYGAQRSPAAFLAHLPFWAILALVDGAIFRSRYRPTTTAVPIDRLHALLENLSDNPTPDMMAL